MKNFSYFLGQDMYDVLNQKSDVRLNNRLGTLTYIYIKENWQ